MDVGRQTDTVQIPQVSLHASLGSRTGRHTSILPATAFALVFAGGRLVVGEIDTARVKWFSQYQKQQNLPKPAALPHGQYEIDEQGIDKFEQWTEAQRSDAA